MGQIIADRPQNESRSCFVQRSVASLALAVNILAILYFFRSSWRVFTHPKGISIKSGGLLLQSFISFSSNVFIYHTVGFAGFKSAEENILKTIEQSERHGGMASSSSKSLCLKIPNGPTVLGGYCTGEPKKQDNAAFRKRCMKYQRNLLYKRKAKPETYDNYRPIPMNEEDDFDLEMEQCRQDVGIIEGLQERLTLGTMIALEDLRPNMFKSQEMRNTQEIKVKSQQTYGYFQFLHSAIMMLLSFSCLLSDKAKRIDAPVAILIVTAIGIYNCKLVDDLYQVLIMKTGQNNEVNTLKA